MDIDKHRIGLYFGSFNPIHYGHIMIAKWCITHSDLDDLYFMVTPRNPFKENKELAEYHHRFNMVYDVCKEEDEMFFACDFEKHLPQPSYTALTIREMEKVNEHSEFVLIMGSDNFLQLDNWKESDFIKCYPMIVILRTDNENETLNDVRERVIKMKESIEKQFFNYQINIADAPITNISSTKIREEIGKGLDISCYTPRVICDYIKENHLYETKK